MEPKQWPKPPVSPRLGTIVYLDKAGTMPYLVVNRVGTTLWLCPERDTLSTHQGNVYNANGEQEWRV